VRVRVGIFRFLFFNVNVSSNTQRQQKIKNKRHYRPRWIIGDVIAGVSVTALLIPKVIAYALIAHLPPEVGLKSAFMGELLAFL